MSIFWLVSYPRSGNTWMRVFLTNYLRDGAEPSSINELATMGIASAHSLFERYTGIASSELTPDEIDASRPDVYRGLAQASVEPHFIKVHDGYTHLPDGQPLFPAEATRGAIYIVRNPLDVAVSMMYYMNDPHLDRSIARMANPRATLAASVKRGGSQFRQKLLTWSDHVRSWLNTSHHFPVHLVSYENMHRDPASTFAQVVTFAGLPSSAERLEKAIRFSQFEIMQQQEALQGFKEGSHAPTPFFRRGQVGGWREHFNSLQIRQLVAEHGEVMRRLGYLTPGGGFSV